MGVEVGDRFRGLIARPPGEPRSESAGEPRGQVRRRWAENGQDEAQMMAVWSFKGEVSMMLGDKPYAAGL